MIIYLFSIQETDLSVNPRSMMVLWVQEHIFHKLDAKQDTQIRCTRGHTIFFWFNFLLSLFLQSFL